MKYLYKAAIIVILIILIYLFQDWLKSFIITSLGGYTKKETVTITNTKTITGKIDTLAVFNHYVETNGIILNPKPEIVTIRDTFYKDRIIDLNLKKFEVSFKDSLIDGKMTIRNRFNGDLHDAKFNYKSLNSFLLRRIDTIRETITNTEYLSKERSKFGIGIGSDSRFNNLDLLGSFTFKNGLQVIYEYSNPIKDFNINIPQLNFEDFSFPREGSHKVKILYNF